MEVKQMNQRKRKHFLWLASAISTVFAIALIPLNLFLLPMPEWISVVMTLLILGVNTLMWVRLSRKYVVKSLLSVLGVFAIIISLFGSYCNPYWNSVSFRNNYGFTKNVDTVLSYRQAKCDLDFAFQYLQKLHPALYRTIPKELEERYEKAVQRLQSENQIDISMLAGEIEGILSLLHDAHTDITLNYENPRYMKYIESHNKAGDSLIAVNGMDVQEMLVQFSDKISYETDSWGIRRLCKYVSTAEGLCYLGILPEDGVVYTYETVKGDTTEQYASEADFLNWDEYAVYNGIKEDSEQGKFVSYEIDREHDLAVLTLTSCINNDEYRNCVREMFAEVQQLGIRNVAVDLRNNGGGDSSVATEFFKYIPVDAYKEWASEWRLGCFLIKNEQTVIQNEKYEDLLFDGDLYLLTSVSTFSSAMDFAEYVKDNHIGTVIGEASSNAPDSYGDISTFVLPESGIMMQISTKKWYRIDNIEGLIEPDIPCSSEQVWETLYEQCEK